MAVKQGDSVYIDAFCPGCEATYYRSIRPLVVGRDKLTPDLFTPLKAGTPPPDPSQPACPVCSTHLRFIAAGTTANTPPVEAAPPTPSSVGGPLSRAAAAYDRDSVAVLFAVEDGEQVVDMKDAGGSYIVVTNKRIVKVSYE